MQLNRLLLSFFFVFLLSGIQAQSRPDQKILQLMEQYKAVGLAVAVVKDNRIIFNRSYGYKDKEEKTLIQNTDIFRIASISKSFTATALMQLAEAGKLSLDDEVSQLVGFKVNNPKFPGTRITLRMLLSHTSSISDKNGYFSLDAINPAKNEKWENAYNNYEPGQGYQYCNLNFNMAGAILEKISGERFDQYIKNHLLQPLHLYGGYNVDSLNSSRLIPLYEYNDSSQNFTRAPGAYASPAERLKNYTPGYSTPIYSPTGGMKISALDLAKYMMMHMNYGTLGNTALLTEQSSKIMQTPLSHPSGYGLALLRSDSLLPGEQMVGHTGSAYGLYSIMFFHPEKKFGFVVITNGCQPVYEKGNIALLRNTVHTLYDHFIRQR